MQNILPIIMMISSSFYLGVIYGKYKGENSPSWLKYTHRCTKVGDIFPDME